MSSLISNMERCTGSFFSPALMERPKARPASETTMPTARSDEPVIPRKDTDERSGSMRLASPPWLVLCSARAERIASRFMAEHSPPGNSRCGGAELTGPRGLGKRGYYGTRGAP
jgi:hypothetical protein